MPAYDTPPPPPTDLLRTKPRRSGLIIAVLGVGLVGMLLALLGFQQAKLEQVSRGPRERSMVKTAKLAHAALMYAEDNGGLNARMDWDKPLKQYGIVASDLKSPLTSYSYYSMRSGANGRDPKKISAPETYALFFDGYGGSGHAMVMDLQNVQYFDGYRRGRERGNVFAFADGHSAFIPARAWNPEDTESGPVR